MINLGTVRPGSTIYIPFDTFAGSTGAPITLTGLATSDILVYKDGGTTERASASGFTLLDTDGIDFDGKTGIHGVSISLADNTTAGFWAAGSRYFVVIGDVTVDSQTVRFLAATFDIGYPDAVINTTIATLASQTSFTLTSGPAEADALNGCQVIIHDVASAVQLGLGTITDYDATTKTVTLAAGTTFTAAAGDNISVFRRVDMTYINGVPASGNGTPDVNVISTSPGAITATSIADGAIDRATFAPDTGLQSVRSSTAQAGASTSITLDASASATTDFYKYQLVTLTGGTGVGQTRIITAYNGTTKVATVTPAWTTNPAAATTFAILPTGIADTVSIGGTAQTARDIGASVLLSNGTGAGQISLSSGLVTLAGVTHTGAVIPTVTTVSGAVGSVTGNVGGNVVGSVASVTGAVGSVTGNVGGNVTGSVNLLTTQSWDGVTTARLYRALVAMLTGKVTVTDNGTTRTLSFKQQDGTTESFSVTVAEADGARSTTGSIT